LTGSSVSVPAGPEITKLPLSQISQSMSAYRPTAAVIGPNPHRPLQAENWAVAPLRLKSRSGRFAIKSPAFSDVGNAHEAAGGRVLVEGQSIGRSKPISIEFSGRLNVCFG